MPAVSLYFLFLSFSPALIAAFYFVPNLKHFTPTVAKCMCMFGHFNTDRTGWVNKLVSKCTLQPRLCVSYRLAEVASSSCSSCPIAHPIPFNVWQSALPVTYWVIIWSQWSKHDWSIFDHADVFTQKIWGCLSLPTRKSIVSANHDAPSQQKCLIPAGSGPSCVPFLCFPCVCKVSLKVLWLPRTGKRYAVGLID